MDIIVTNIEFDYENGYLAGASSVNASFTSFNTVDNRSHLSGSINMSVEEFDNNNLATMSFDGIKSFIKTKIIEKIEAGIINIPTETV